MAYWRVPMAYSTASLQHECAIDAHQVLRVRKSALAACKTLEKQRCVLGVAPRDTYAPGQG